MIPVLTPTQYEEHGDNFVHLLRGDFAFVVYNSETGDYLAARDPIGVCT